MPDNFKAHADKYGPKLGDGQASGETELQRRYREAEDRERERIMEGRKARRMEAMEAAWKAEADRYEGQARMIEEARLGKRAAHRPRVVGEPWKAEGVSRAEWYRRRKGD